MILKKNKIVLSVILFIFVFLFIAENKNIPIANMKNSYIAIIIDDFGNSQEGYENMIKLPVKITGAVMPGMPNSKKEAQLLKENGHDVILHLPMQAHTGKISWLGPVNIQENDSREKIISTITNSIDEIDNLIGINNHMGSKIMENEKILDIIFPIIKEKELIFIDSVTTNKSKAEEIAKKYDVKYYKRDVFLDSTDSQDLIEKNLIKAGDAALKNGYSICIGHVGNEGGYVTYNAIMNKYKELEKKGIKFVGISDIDKITKDVLIFS